MPCEIEEIKELEKLKNANYLIVHFSWWEEEKICSECNWISEEVPVERIFNFAKNLSIKNIVFVHIDEVHGKSYSDFKNLKENTKNITLNLHSMG